MQKKRKIFLSVSLVIGVFIVLHYTGWLAPVERWLRSGINTASSFIFNISTVSEKLDTAFSNKFDLAKKIEELEKELSNSFVDRARLVQLEDENTRLREELEFFTSTSTHGIEAQTIGRSVDPIATTIAIDKGSENGVKLHRPVIMGKGIYIGRVVQVHERTSIVQLINDTQSRVAATILNKDHSLGIAEGGFGISVRLKFIPQNEEIRPGDIIVTSGLAQFIPRGLVIGTVEAVEKKPQEPFQQAILKPIHNLNDITVVSVLVTD